MNKTVKECLNWELFRIRDEVSERRHELNVAQARVDAISLKLAELERRESDLREALGIESVEVADTTLHWIDGTP